MSNCNTGKMSEEMKAAVRATKAAKAKERYGEGKDKIKSKRQEITEKAPRVNGKFSEKSQQALRIEAVNREMASKALKRPTRINDQGAIITTRGDNANYVNFSLEMINWGDVDYQNSVSVKNRVAQYMQHCVDWDIKPGMASISVALGKSRGWLWRVCNDDEWAYKHYPEDVVDVLRQIYGILECNWEQYMMNGKINPASGIFLGANNFNYKNVSEFVLTPNQAVADRVSAEAMQRRIEALPD